MCSAFADFAEVESSLFYFNFVYISFKNTAVISGVGRAAPTAGVSQYALPRSTRRLVSNHIFFLISPTQVIRLAKIRPCIDNFA